VPICVIFNPAARGYKANRFRKFIELIGREAVLRSTSAPNSAVALAAAAVREGFDTIVAAGGDGTLNEVINGICSVPGGRAKTRLGILPVGTMNVFARELGLPLAVHAAWQTIQRGSEIWVDLAAAEFGTGGISQKRYFIQMAGAGLDARAIELVDFGTKKVVGPIAYVLAGLKALHSPQPKIRVKTAEVEIEGELVLLGNGRLYGGPFRVFPEATPFDGLLDVCVFPKANYGMLALCGPVLLATRKLPANAVRRFKANTVRLESAAHVPVEVDGEFAGQLPVTFTVETQTLRVIAP